MFVLSSLNVTKCSVNIPDVECQRKVIVWLKKYVLYIIYYFISSLSSDNPMYISRSGAL